MTLEDRRLKLHSELCRVLGSRNVYYDPPSSINMKYPAIVYSRYRVDTRKADNIGYLRDAGFSVTLIRKDDDDDCLDRLLDLPFASFDRSFSADNMHHDVLTVFV